jgi:hypothetical protein
LALGSNHFVYDQIYFLVICFYWNLRLALFTLISGGYMKTTVENDVFVVMEGSKIGGVYRWRDDANAHAQAVGGLVVVQGIKNKIPGWVETMVASAKEKAEMQNSVVRR